MAVAPAFDTADTALRSVGRRLVEQRPELKRPLLAARDAYARSYVRTRAIVNAVRYDAPIEPYRLIRVDPAEIEVARETGVPKFRIAGTVVGGDWDRTDSRFEDYDVFRAYARHFEEGVPWEDTEFYDRIVGLLEEGEVKWGCATEAEFRERCERLEELYASIEEHGYKSQEELHAGGVSDPIRSGTRLKTERLKDEIAVHIDRDGDLLFDDGRNRLSIAKVQGLDSVPVRVLQRHERWQAIRDAYVRGDDRVRDCGDHPDLRYLEFGGN